MFSLEELWVKLTRPEIGFYTARRAGAIPAAPGVYAWFLPLWLKGTPQELLARARLLFAYDPPSLGPGRWEETEAGFRWDPLHVQIERRTEISLSPKQQDLWGLVHDAPEPARTQFRIALMAATIFAKPLYVGLSNNLLRRYTDHTSGGSTFNQRFTQYIERLDFKLSVHQLLFVCVPLRAAGAQIDEYTEPQIRALEDILKTLCQPAFGDL